MADQIWGYAELEYLEQKQQFYFRIFTKQDFDVVGVDGMTLPLSPPQDKGRHHSNISGIRCFMGLSQSGTLSRTRGEWWFRSYLWTSPVWCCRSPPGRLADWM